MAPAPLIQPEAAGAAHAGRPHARASGHAGRGAAGGAGLDPAASAGAVRRRRWSRDGGRAGAGAARPAGQPAEGHAGGRRRRRWRRRGSRRRRRRSRPGGCGSTGGGRSRRRRRSRPGWSRSRTRAASSSRPWSGAAPEMRVADWCAGAGGKTLALAMTMDNRGHAGRLRRVGAAAGGRGAAAAPGRGAQCRSGICWRPGDKWAKRRAGGVRPRAGGRALHRHRHLAAQSGRAAAAARARPGGAGAKQAAILDAAARLVRPGGRLVYATCSLLPEENEAQVRRFLARTPGFRRACRWRTPGRWAPPPCAGPYLSLTPLRHGTDGFFGAVLERAA